jgi:hypothetical protein
MLDILSKVLRDAGDRLHYHVTTYLPSLLAALTLILSFYVAAVLARWVLHKIFKGLTIDKFLRQSGVAYMIDSSGRLRASRLVAEAAYWSLLLSGLLIGLSVFNTNLTTHMIEGFVFLLPKLLVAGLILLAGAWLSQYLGRGFLVWAVNEDLPMPRRLAAVVRVLIMFVSIVVAAEHLDFARNVFFAAFVIVVGGAVLTAVIAVAAAAAGGLRRMLDDRRVQREERGERSLWSHL